jgi:ABC-type transport system involved in multi-copper enzyme maturation permease subunit
MMSDGLSETTGKLADILAGRILGYIAFCIIIALITFIALVIWQASYHPVYPLP